MRNTREEMSDQEAHNSKPAVSHVDSCLLGREVCLAERVKFPSSTPHKIAGFLQWIHVTAQVKSNLTYQSKTSTKVPEPPVIPGLY